MKIAYKYFIEHKTLHTWVTIEGALTNDPNDGGLIMFDERWIAEKYLQPVEPEITSDFSGNNIHYDYTSQSIWNALKDGISKKNNGADLYKDFIITEHAFN